jgi:hypothetical protein
MPASPATNLLNLTDTTTVTAYGYPKRDSTPEMRAEWIDIDGKRYELR